MKIAVFAQDEAAAVFDREDGFRRVARLQVFAADHVAVDDLDRVGQRGNEVPCERPSVQMETS